MDVDEITKEDFDDYETVRESGVVNMFFYRQVMALSGLSKDQVMCIMKNYVPLREKFDFSRE